MTHPKIMELVNGEDAVEVANREEGERVVNSAANPSAFTVERNGDGRWRVRYSGRDS